MRKFRITFLKTQRVVSTGQPDVVYLAEQEVTTDCTNFPIVVPQGYVLFQVIELLPAKNISTDDN